MNYCKRCTYIRSEYVNRIMNTPKGPVPHSGKVFMCSNPEFLHPVEEEPMPCNIVRDNDSLCGLAGKGYIQKPEVSAEVIKFPGKTDAGEIIIEQT